MQPETKPESFDFDNFVTWLYENRMKVGIVAAVLAVVIAVVAIVSWKKAQNETDANAALFALPALIGPSGRTAEVRSESFQKIAGEFPDTSAGDRAALLAGGILFTDGKYAEAEKQFSKFLSENQESPLRAQAAVGVAASLEAQGKLNESVTKYQDILAKYSGENVVAPSKLTLARLLEGQNKPEEALKLYEDLTRSKNPYDPWSAEAGERREQLLQKFPNLKVNPPVAASVPTSVKVPASTNQPSSK